MFKLKSKIYAYANGKEVFGTIQELREKKQKKNTSAFKRHWTTTSKPHFSQMDCQTQPRSLADGSLCWANSESLNEYIMIKLAMVHLGLVCTQCGFVCYVFSKAVNLWITRERNLICS